MKMDEVIPRHTVDQLLAELGLQKRESMSSYILPALGVFAAGAVVGAAIGLMLAPSSGRELRSEIEKKVRSRTPDGEMVPQDNNTPRA